MADSSIDITAGTGTSIDTRTEASNGQHRQVVVLGDPSVNAGVAPVDGVLGLSTYFSTQPTISVVGPLTAGSTISVYQGTGTPAWRVTQATLSVITNVTGYALESGGNLDSIVTTLNSIKSKTDNLDVTLGSRLASGGTLPITGTISALNAGGSLTAFQGGGAWLITQATLPVMANIVNSPSILTAGGSLSAFQSGTWTVQPGNTPNTTAWLVTMPTLPVAVGTHSVLAAGGSLAAFQGSAPWLVTFATLPAQVSQVGTWTVQPGNTPNTTAWLVTLATLPVLNAGKYLPTLLSLSSNQYNENKLDLFGNLMVNTNVPLPNSTRFNRFLTFASMASVMAAPGTGKRLVVREMDFSGNATLSVKLVEDHAGTPVTVWGPHYFLPYAGFIKPTCYIPITSNKSLGIDITGSTFNSTLDIRIETENV